MWTQGLPPRDGELYYVSFKGTSADERCYACARWVDGNWRSGKTTKGVVIYVVEDRITHWSEFERIVDTPVVRRRVRRENHA